MANEWQIEAANAEVVTRSAAISGQVEAVYAESATRLASPGARVEAGYPEVLTSSKPSGPYASEVLADNPLAWWRQDDASNPSSITDMSGAGRHATNAGFGTITTTAPIGSESTSALAYAAGAYATISTPNWVPTTGDLSVEAWFKSTTGGDQSLVAMDDIQQGPGSPLRRFNLYLHSGSLVFMCFTTAGAYPYAQTTGTYNDGNWHHVVATRTATTLTIYVDGASVATQAVSGTYAGDNTADLFIAATKYTAPGPGQSYLFTGSLDEVAVYGSALTSARVSAHYNAIPASSGPITGSLGGTLPTMTGAGTATQTVPVFTGSLTGSLPPITGSATATEQDPGTGVLTGTLPAITGSGTATQAAPVFTGSLSGTLPVITGTGTATEDVPMTTGVLSGTLPAIVGDASGSTTVPIFTGTMTGTLTPIVGDGAAAVDNPGITQGAVSGVLPVIVGSLEATYTAPPPGTASGIRVWDAPTASWPMHPVKVWDPGTSTWIAHPIKVWDSASGAWVLGR